MSHYSRVHLFLWGIASAHTRPLTTGSPRGARWGVFPVCSARGSVKLFASENTPRSRLAAVHGWTVPGRSPGEARQPLDQNAFSPSRRRPDPGAARCHRRAAQRWGQHAAGLGFERSPHLRPPGGQRIPAHVGPVQPAPRVTGPWENGSLPPRLRRCETRPRLLFLALVLVSRLGPSVRDGFYEIKEQKSGPDV